MPRPRNHVPTYRLHKQSGQAIVTISANGTRRDVLLGKYGSPESQAEYRRVLAELAAAGHTAAVLRLSPGTVPTLNELLVAFMEWAVTHYRTPDGKPTTEIGELKWSLRPLKELYGDTPAVEFGPKALATVRQHMIGLGWCRSLVNKRADRIRRVFKWGTSEELVPVAVHQALKTLAGLRKGRTEARESEPVKPVDPAHVDATLPFLNRHVRAMVELQRLTGMRPGEACALVVGDVDRSGELWVYRPTERKTRHRGKSRVIPFGPRARAVHTAFLIGDKSPPSGWEGVDLAGDRTGRLVMADAYQEAGRERDAVLLRDLAREVVLVVGCVVDPTTPVFRTWEAREERFRAMRANRKSKVCPSQQNRKTAKPTRFPRERFSGERYANAVADAAEKAGVPRWAPNQLRHLYATEVRKSHGLEAAQVSLGHSRADVTQVYAERDEALAAKVAAEIG